MSPLSDLVAETADETLPSDRRERRISEEALSEPWRLILDIARTEDRLRYQREALALALQTETTARQEANRASDAKSSFLAAMSHELRTPLNAIIGITEILIEDAEAQRLGSFVEPLERVHRAGEHLLELINDILNISKIEAGKMTLRPDVVDVPALLREVLETTRPMAERNTNAITLDCAAEVDVIVVDPLRLKQILLNLVSNACKFTQQGTIAVTVSLVGSGARQWVRFAVRDSGVGMTSEQVDHLFQPFMQGDPSSPAAGQGTGLGLALSRKLSQLLGGEILVESKPGHGSVFTLEIPLDAA